MFGSQVLEVAIGLTFVYILLSLICSIITELLARFVGYRSRTLKKAMHHIVKINIPSDSKKELLTIDHLYKHPLIAGLSMPGLTQRISRGKGRPSYISGDTFATVVFDTIIKAGKPTTHKPLSEEIYSQSLNSDEVKILNIAITGLPDESVQLKQYLETVKNNTTMISDVPKMAAVTFQQLQDGVENLEDSLLKDSFQSILNTAQDNAKDWDDALTKARFGVEKWFDEYMNRVNGWYKRNTQTIILFLAFAIAFVGNIDSVAIGKTLWVDATLRGALANQATTFVVESVETTGIDTIDTVAEEADKGTVSTIPSDKVIDEESPSIADLQEELRGLGLPIGWYRKYDEGQGDYNIWDIPTSLFIEQLESNTSPVLIKDLRMGKQLWEPGMQTSEMVSKFFGFLITALAVSLGAPFWFDLLGKLVNLRTTGVPTEENKK